MPSGPTDRAQAIQIGAVLIFGILIVFLALYQGFVVPDQNEEIEFNHNQELQGELVDLRSTVNSMPGTTTTQSSSVTLGVRYPSRAIFVNPGPVSGTLQTTGTTDDTLNLTVHNATADGNTGDYWSGTSRSYNTGAIEYRPSYNLYATAPRTVYEHSVVYNRFNPEATLSLTDQAIISGDTITLVALNGSFSESRVDTASIDFEPVSTNTRTVSVSNESHNVTISVPTAMNESEWREVFEEEMTDNGGNVTGVTTTDIEDHDDLSLLEIDLEPGNYSLQLSKVGVGTGITGTEAAYMTDVDGDGANITADQSHEFVVEVRDKFNNPTSDVSVEGSPEGDSFTGDSTQQTNDEGQATFEYRGTKSGTHQINFTIDSASNLDSSHDASSPENVTMTVTVEDESPDGGESAFRITWDDDSDAERSITDQPGVEEDNGDFIYDVEEAVEETGSNNLLLNASTDRNVDRGKADFAIGDESIGTVDSESGISGGETETVFDPREEGIVDVFVSAGGSGDVLTLDVRNFVESEFELLVDPDTAGEEAKHNWTFDDVDYGDNEQGEDVDTITVDYSGTDTDLTGIGTDDVTVVLTRMLSDGEDTEEITLNSVSVEGDGEIATFYLSGNFDTNIVGESYVKIEGLQNPPEAKPDHEAEITFDGEPDVVTLDTTFSIEPAEVDSIDATDETTTAGQQGSIDVTAEDEFGNDVEDFSIGVENADGIDDLDGASESTQDGTATFTFTEEDADDYTVTFELEGDADTTDTSDVTVEPAGPNSVEVDPGDDTATADGADELSYTATVTDEFGNTIEGVTVETSAEEDAEDIEFGGDDSLETDADGEVEVTVTSTTAQEDVTFTFEEQENNNQDTATGTFEEEATGTVDLQDEILTNDDEFEVDWQAQNTGGEATLVVENTDEEDEVELNVGDGDDIETIDADDVGGLGNGDTIEATLYESDDRQDALDNDTTEVSTPSQANLVERVDGSVTVQGGDRPRFEFTTDGEVEIDAAAIETTGNLENVGTGTQGNRGFFEIGGERSSQNQDDTDGNFMYDFDPALTFDENDGETLTEYDRLDSDIEILGIVEDEEEADLIISFQFTDDSVKTFYFEADLEQ